MSYGALSQSRRSPNNFLDSTEENSTFQNRRRNEINERSPLIIIPRQNPYSNLEPLINWKVLFLLCIFIFGTSIGVYLMFLEYGEINANFPYNLIELKSWHSGDVEILQNLTQLNLPVINVIFSFTRGSHCTTVQMCTEIINDMINTDLADIPHNFLMSSVGDTYEVRGWKHVNGISQFPFDDKTIAIGFIGSNPPIEYQLKEVKAFFSEAIRRHQLSRDFKIYIKEIKNKRMLHHITKMNQFSGFV